MEVPEFYNPALTTEKVHITAKKDLDVYKSLNDIYTFTNRIKGSVFPMEQELTKMTKGIVSDWRLLVSKYGDIKDFIEDYDSTDSDSVDPKIVGQVDKFHKYVSDHADSVKYLHEHPNFTDKIDETLAWLYELR